MIVFDSIMEKLAANGWTAYRIRKEKILPESVMSRLRNGQAITTVTLDKLCSLCDCQPSDLLHYERDNRGD